MSRAAMGILARFSQGKPSESKGYAKKAAVSVRQQVKAVASQGRGGDTRLAHLSPKTARMMDDRIHGGRKQVNPKTGLREYMLPKNFYDSMPTQESGSCALHSTDNVLRGLKYKESQKAINRRKTPEMKDSFNRVKNKFKEIGEDKGQSTEMVDVLGRSGLKYNTLDPHNLPKGIKTALKNKNQVIHTGIAGLHPESSQYKIDSNKNKQKQNTDESHALNITRMNLYPPHKQQRIGRKGSLDFLDSNFGTDNVKKQPMRGLLSNDDLVYSAKFPSNSKNPQQPPHFNLQNKPDNLTYTIDSNKSIDNLTNEKLYPFDQ